MRRRIVYLLLLVVLAVSTVAVFGRTWSNQPLDFYSARSLLLENNRTLYKQIKRTIQDNDVDLISAAPPDTQRIHLLLSPADVAHLDDLYEKFTDPAFGVDYYAQHNAWRKATLVYDNRPYDIKIKAHGKNPTDHKAGQFLSYAIKMSKDANLFNATRFSLIVRNRIQSDRHILKHFASEFSILYHDLDLIRVAVNDWPEKLFYFQPRFDDAFFEKKALSSMRVFRRSVSPTESSHKTMLNLHAVSAGPFAADVYERDFHAILDEGGYTPAQKTQLIARHNQLNEIIKQGEYARVLEFVDLDYISSFEAFRSLIGASRHGFHIEANFHIVYDTANGKFYPVVTEDTYWRRISLDDDETLEHFLDTQETHDDKEILLFFNLLSRNDIVRHRKYQKMHAVLQDSADTEIAHQRVMDASEELHAFGLLRTLLRKYELSGFPVHTKHNFELARAYLEQAEPQVVCQYRANGLSLQLRPQSMAGVQVANFQLVGLPQQAETSVVVKVLESDQPPRTLLARECVNAEEEYRKLFAGLIFADGVSADSCRQTRSYTVDIQWRDAKLIPAATDCELRLTLANAITGSSVDAEVEFTADLESPLEIEPLDLTQPGDLDLAPKAIDCEIKQNQIIVRPGVYEIHEDLVLPAAMKLVLPAGTTLLLGHEVLVVCKNGIEVRGTESEPVVIDAIDPAKPFGAVGILGTGKTTSYIEHLHIRNGNERVGEGVYFSGALSIYHNGSVEIRSSLISKSHADDGLNVKYSRVLIDDVTFADNFADQVDLDYCEALVVNSHFHNGRGDTNGDGLDFSGSLALVLDCTFSNMADKGVSIGEQSTVYLTRNQFRQNRMGFALKDSSVAHVYDNEFTGNDIDASLYKKKALWSAVTCFVASHGPEAQHLAYSRDEHSTLVQQTISQPAVEELMQRALETAADSGCEQLPDVLAEAGEVFKHQPPVDAAVASAERAHGQSEGAP